MLFDLSNLALEESAQIQLKHPGTGEYLFADADKTQIVGIEIEGEASATYRAAIDARSRKYLALKGKQMSPEEIRQNDVELFTTLSVKGVNFTYNGKELATAEDFKALYSDPKYVWVNKQIDAAIGDPSNFLK